MFKKREKGFTLIELMIVVAIIGILAAIAIPRFADLIKKSKEGATKGNLGALRSALSIYYGEQEGVYPNTLATLASEAKYIEAIPAVKTGPHSGAAHADGLSSEAAFVSASYTSKPGTVPTSDTGNWGYWSNASTTPTMAGVFVNCTGTDSKGDSIHSW